jgi:hypothetical protein
MTFPDRRLERPVEPPETRSENTQDVIPPSQRNQDLDRSSHDLVAENARPLTDEERKAADRDMPPGERVYAPASERVPRTVAGYQDVVENVDAATAERQAASHGTAMDEPSFTRVPRPSSLSEETSSETSSTDWQQSRWIASSGSSAGLLPKGLGWLTLGVCGGVGIWLWVRWQRERNRPINRLRRQARQTAAQARQTAAQARHAASEWRERMPEMEFPDLEFPDDAARPAIGLGTALASIALLWWQQSQSRSRASQARAAARKAQHAVSATDWQQRLLQLKERWTPGRLQLENISISRH